MAKDFSEYKLNQDAAGGRDLSFTSLLDENRALRSLIVEISLQCSRLRKTRYARPTDDRSEKPLIH